MSSFWVSLFMGSLARMVRRSDSDKAIRASGVRIFIPATFSTKRNGLAAATTLNFSRAAMLASSPGNPGIVVSSSCSHPFPGADGSEKAFKRLLIRRFEEVERLAIRHIFGRSIVNSIDEIKSAKEALDAAGIDYSKGVCVVTCDFHSRAMALIAEEILGVKVFVACNSYANEVEPDHPTKDQRTWLRWLPCSVARYVAVRIAVSGFSKEQRLRMLDRLAEIKHAGEGA